MQRRELDYETEMTHAFENWHGTPLCDMEDFDGTPL
eukprot:COSAG02_NODE_5283_length_4472_cov_4.205351_3_plen_36_part_00